MASNYADEFPLLAAQNLYAADIKGDGKSQNINCFIQYTDII